MKYLGAFAEVFSIRPWEWDELPALEVLALVAYIDDRKKNSG